MTRLLAEKTAPVFHPLTRADGRTFWVPVWRQSDRALYLSRRIAEGRKTT